ncbi:MAG: dTDP-4-dehydrorhamnose 3,5-epimerase [Bacteroidetes bacterium]|nr:MAG: dTDP-4-dehydrorhamnose 3,5-epimerase [Bacteroidota bacterium]
MKTVEALEGVIVKELPAFSDHRGGLVETFRIDDLPEFVRPVMSYVSFTRPGRYRGPHEHHVRYEVFAFPGPGDALVTLWDNREWSPTRNGKMVIAAGASKPRLVVIPPGIVHVVENDSAEDLLLVNYPTTLYKGWGRDKEFTDEVRYEHDESPFWKDYAEDLKGRHRHED